MFLKLYKHGVESQIQGGRTAKKMIECYISIEENFKSNLIFSSCLILQLDVFVSGWI